jgi:SAM-dependent methyltransferase
MEKPNYGNWVPTKLLILLACGSAAMLALLILTLCFHLSWIWVILSALLLVATLGVFTYMLSFHNKLSFEKGGLMGKVHAFVADHLPWDGKGKLLDVGCGAGALTTRAAKRFPEAQCHGIDYWGAGWDYSLQMCERNAKAEGVADRCHFQKGDANHLDFPDETFDAVVSKGGSFALQDIFGQKSIYRDFDATVARLKAYGIVSEIHYVKNSEKEIGLPRWMAIPGMLADIGLIYGKK